MMRALVFGCLLLGVIEPHVARAADRTDAAEVCARAAEEAQNLRARGRLLDALTELRTCLRTSCPEVIRGDCAGWRADVEASMPTVILSARTAAGDDLVAVKVLVDDNPYLDGIDGIARPLDPGPHRVRFETSGSAPVEIDVVLGEGEKRRPVAVTFPAADLPRAAVSPKAATAPKEETSRVSGDGLAPTRPASQVGARPVLWPWIAAGGLASFAGFAVLAITGLSDLHAMEGGCGRTGTCESGDVSALRARFWIADGLLGLGVVSTSVATWLYFKRRRAAALSFRLVGPTACVQVDGRF